MAMKLVWAYAGIIFGGALLAVLYFKWQDEGGWVGFLGWAAIMASAVTFGVFRGRKKRQEIEAEDARRTRG